MFDQIQLNLENYIQLIGLSLDFIGILAIVIGFAISIFLALRRLTNKRANNHNDFKLFRQSLARSILIGLEFLVAGDIIRTVAGDLTPTGVLTLGGIVLIRIVLGLTLEAEISGQLKWYNPFWRRKKSKKSD
ncbi:hypothetical protein CR956_00215 [Candidatus Saccharibacteria bacterium]|nr:MAG: hypothetical protein CR956_00215 [Candidatus Saccharibacteria bacterium]